MTGWLVVLGLILAPLALAVGTMIHFFVADEEWQGGSSFSRQLLRRDERERRAQ